MVSLLLATFYTASVFWLRYLYNPSVVSIERDYIDWNTTFPSLTLWLIAQIALLVLESAVAIIQSYVFAACTIESINQRWCSIWSENHIWNITQIFYNDYYLKRTWFY